MVTNTKMFQNGTVLFGYWRASEASETLLVKFNGIRDTYIHTYIYIYVYVIARVGVKFVPETSRLTVLLKINTLASLLFI